MRPLPFAEPLARDLDARGVPARRSTWRRAAWSTCRCSRRCSSSATSCSVVEPLAVDRTRLTMHLVLAPDADPEIDLLRLRVDEDFVSFGTPDDLDMFERVQRGLGIPEMEWVDVSRGLGDRTDVALPDGTIVGPITSEAPLRGLPRPLRAADGDRGDDPCPLTGRAARRAALRDDGVVVVPGLLDDVVVRPPARRPSSAAAPTPSPHYGVLSPPGRAAGRQRPVPLGRRPRPPRRHPRLAARRLAPCALLDEDAVVLVEDQWFASEPGRDHAEPVAPGRAVLPPRPAVPDDLGHARRHRRRQLAARRAGLAPRPDVRAWSSSRPTSATIDAGDRGRPSRSGRRGRPRPARRAGVVAAGRRRHRPRLPDAPRHGPGARSPARSGGSRRGGRRPDDPVPSPGPRRRRRSGTCSRTASATATRSPATCSRSSAHAS